MKFLQEEQRATAGDKMKCDPEKGQAVQQEVGWRVKDLEKKITENYARVSRRTPCSGPNKQTPNL